MNAVSRPLPEKKKVHFKVAETALILMFSFQHGQESSGQGTEGGSTYVAGGAKKEWRKTRVKGPSGIDNKDFVDIK